MNDWDRGLAGLGMGALGALGGLFGGEPNYNKYYQGGENQINNAVSQAQKYLSPYDKAGEAGLGHYQQMLQNLSNPGAFYNHLMSGFSMSPAQKYAQHQALNAVSNNAAVKGLMGSGQEAKSLENTAAMTTQQDQQQYLNNLMGMYHDALGGYGNLGQMGFDAAGRMGQYGMQGAEDYAQLQSAMAQAKAAENQSEDSGIGGIVSGIAGLF